MEWGIVMAAFTLFGMLVLAIAAVRMEDEGKEDVHGIPKRYPRTLKKAA